MQDPELYERYQADFATLYERAPVPYISLAPDGMILLVNQNWLNLTGLPRESVQGRPFLEQVIPDDRAVVERLLADPGSLSGRSAPMISLCNTHGDAVPVRIRCTRVMDDDGNMLRLHCSLQDAHPEIDALKARDASEGRYRRLVEMAREGIWEIDTEANTVFVNPAMARMLEYEPAQMIGMHLFEFMDDRGKEIASRNLERRERGIDEQHDFEFVTSTGRRIITTIETVPLTDEAGNYTGSLAGVMDVTDRRNLEAEMLRTQKNESLGILAGGVAHDFNNLLQTIVGNTELALVDLEGPVADCIGNIQVATQRAADLCRQLLAYAGQARFQSRAVDLSALAREMSSILRVNLSKKARFELDLAADLPLVSGDPGQLGQVVMNLVTNAAEALPGGRGTVRVSTRIDGQDCPDAEAGCVVLTVADDGVGMDSETADKIFDPFFSTKFAGRGLGLAAVQGIVEAHCGAVRVASAPGSGTSIAVSFPISDRPAGPAEDRAPDERPLPTLRILLADDEAGVRQTVGSHLERMGQTVCLVENGQQAVERFATESCDLVILDLAMPVMDGWEAMKAIRDLDPAVPIAVCSGFPADEVGRGLGQDQPFAVLQKPFFLPELSALLRKVRPGD